MNFQHSCGSNRSQILPSAFEGSGSDPSQMRFEFGEGHFNRIEVGAVGGQERNQQPRCLRASVDVGGQIVEDATVPGFDTNAGPS